MDGSQMETTLLFFAAFSNLCFCRLVPDAWPIILLLLGSPKTFKAEDSLRKIWNSFHFNLLAKKTALGLKHSGLEPVC